MMDSHNHPVWHLMDRSAKRASRYSQADDPRLTSLQAFCQSIAEEVARIPAPDAALFRRALNRHRRLPRRADPGAAARRAGGGRRARAGRAPRHPRAALSQRLADQMVDRAHDAGHAALRHRRAGPRCSPRRCCASATMPSRPMAYLKTVDDLLWSLQIPDHPQSRQRLLAAAAGAAAAPARRHGADRAAAPGTAGRPRRADADPRRSAAPRQPPARARPQTPEEIVQSMREEVVSRCAPGRSRSATR